MRNVMEHILYNFIGVNIFRDISIYSIRQRFDNLLNTFHVLKILLIPFLHLQSLKKNPQYFIFNLHTFHTYLSYIKSLNLHSWKSHQTTKYAFTRQTKSLQYQENQKRFTMRLSKSSLLLHGRTCRTNLSRL